MFSFIRKARIIREDIRPGRPIFYIYDLLGLVMLFAAWGGWHDLAPFRAQQPVVAVDLTEVAMLGFIGFYGLRIAMFIALARGLRMPQPVEWLVAIVPAFVAVVCIFLSGPIERAFAASEGYTYCRRVDDKDARSTSYVFALHQSACPVSRTG